MENFQTLSEDDSPAVGMSDEEELKRAGDYYANGQGVGEVLVDLEEDFEPDLTDLGFKE